ncbi:hypothetical protein [Duganella violaceipulchra]|uniref:Uncharacterized protein n=1 Tax=Duganella violaceipulchra TaxID=2849652 RepID=A0AA41H3S4_9BURK|nr:hypothetical protein [Duganella violaceicalia]MBV6320317.1 hypothetical protein [Duganella violaceicalia]MCP2011765.1 hypothetical protein [Duganella violaceicalia]
MSGFFASVSHHECEIRELRADRELAIEYLKIAVQALGNPDECAAASRMLQALTEAYGGLESLRLDAGINGSDWKCATAALSSR